MDVYEMVDKLMYVNSTALEHASNSAVMLAYEFKHMSPDMVHKEILMSLREHYENTGLGFSIISDIIIGEYLRYALNLLIEQEKNKYPDIPFEIFTAFCPITLNMKTGRLCLFDSAICTAIDIRIAMQIFEERLMTFNAVKNLKPDELINRCKLLLRELSISFPGEDSDLFKSPVICNRYEDLGMPMRYKLCILDITMGLIRNYCVKNECTISVDRIDYAAIIFDGPALCKKLVSSKE